MLTPHNDNLINLLASLGMTTDCPQEIVIHDFDQWTDPEVTQLAACVSCGASFDIPMGAAA
jgi:hypothetical protein